MKASAYSNCVAAAVAIAVTWPEVTVPAQAMRYPRCQNAGCRQADVFPRVKRQSTYPVSHLRYA